MTTALIFFATYTVVSLGRVPFVPLGRTGAAVLGATLMVATGAISPADALRTIDLRTLALLGSMMIIVGYLRLAGGLAAFARWVGISISSPVRLLVAIVFTAGGLSALFVNDTICLVFTPIVLDLAVSRGLPPLPYLLALATASNIGSAATLTGNPQNILIGTVSGISFVRFVQALGPIALVGLVLDAVLIWAVFHRALVASAPSPAALPQVEVHWPLLWKTLAVTAAVLAGFLSGLRVDIVAVIGASVLLVLAPVNLRKIHAAVDWRLLWLFAGLFITVGAAERAGFDRRVFDGLRPLGVATVAGLSATTGLLSNVISNVPAVMLLAKIIPRLPDPDNAWIVLAMSSTLAGNLTILGSIANLIVVEGARRRRVEISFGGYARIGAPLSLATIGVGVWWLS